MPLERMKGESHRPRTYDAPFVQPSPGVTEVDRLLAAIENALKVRILNADPAHPGYLRSLDSLRSSYARVMSVAPDGLEVCIRWGGLFWRGLVMLGGRRYSLLYRALESAGASELHLTGGATWTELARLMECLHELASGASAAADLRSLEDLPFVCLERSPV